MRMRRGTRQNEPRSRNAVRWRMLTRCVCWGTKSSSILNRGKMWCCANLRRTCLAPNRLKWPRLASSRLLQPRFPRRSTSCCARNSSKKTKTEITTRRTRPFRWALSMPCPWRPAICSARWLNSPSRRSPCRFRNATCRALPWGLRAAPTNESGKNLQIVVVALWRLLPKTTTRNRCIA